jgi:uncharacterized protein YdaU (DUF1376 family)
MSRNDTWMPLYIGDYLADTMHLSGAQHGAYLLLLMHYWRNGPLPTDHAELAAIARFDSRSWKAVAAPVLRFFIAKDGQLHQKRMDAELERWAQISGKRREAGKAGAEAKWKPNGGKPPDKPHGKQMANATTLPVDKMANAKTENGKCHDFAIPPVPSQSKSLNLLTEEEKKGARARPSEINAVVAELGKSLKAENPPFVPSRVFQLAALEDAPRRPQPQDPVRSIEEQKAWLAAEIARERGAA